MQKSKQKKYLTQIGILIIVNTIAFGLLMKGPETIEGNIRAALYANLIGFNVIGFILGAVVALFPYKNLPYKQKYLRASLLVILTIQTIMAIMLILNGVMNILMRY